MSLAFLIYFISLLEPLSVLLQTIVGICLFAGVFSLITMVAELYSDSAAVKKWVIRFAVVGFLASVVQVVVPTEKTAWMMVGGYVAQTAYESEAGDKIKKIVSNKLDQILEEQLESTKEKK